MLVDVPEERTTDPEEMDYGDEWATEDSVGQELTRGMDLGDSLSHHVRPQALFYNVHCWGNFYILNRMSWSLNQIRSPTSLDEIILNV